MTDDPSKCFKCGKYPPHPPYENYICFICMEDIGLDGPQFSFMHEYEIIRHQYCDFCGKFRNCLFSNLTLCYDHKVDPNEILND